MGKEGRHTHLSAADEAKNGKVNNETDIASSVSCIFSCDKNKNTKLKQIAALMIHLNIMN